jgi:uncharacterized protein YecT (DUF1311 family)
MKRISGVITVLSVIFLAAEAQADPILECSNQFGSQVEIGNCLAEVEKNVDASIEATLGFAMVSAKELDAVTGRKVAMPALTAGQAAWVSYRDQHCEFVGATFGGGSGTGAAILGCRIELGRIRADTLMEFVQ